MFKVVSIKSVGGACKRGVYYDGFGLAMLDNHKTVYVPKEFNSLSGICDFCDTKGHDTKEMRQKLDHWVKTGEGLTFGLQ